MGFDEDDNDDIEDSNEFNTKDDEKTSEDLLWSGNE